MVREEGLEPSSPLQASGPKPGAVTNFATRALSSSKDPTKVGSEIAHPETTLRANGIEPSRTLFQK